MSTIEPVFERYVAIGDSQTEGVGDPGADGMFRGWADRFAGALAEVNPQLRYANLAVRGSRAVDIRRDQLAAAVALKPDLATVVAGMNDLIRPRFDRDALLADLDAMYSALRGTGATVLTFTFPDIGAIAPVARALSNRVRVVNADVRRLAGEHGLVVVDFEPCPATVDRRVWCDDRLHLNPLGHNLVAHAVANTLAMPGFDDTWREPLPPRAADSLAALATAELRWAATYLAPWIGRRLRGTSSRDGSAAKRPVLQPLTPGDSDPR
ncbi:SGNH/GDSL hydrolase family protein [Nocardia huaxiensis]|uniref:SGNH/GDSL hydrolase family protein n=1 Tax=Nocardia huaxiensis TaxID=2755382 RepID=A0A7D6ZV74_9NOCA|nr:SGNH/GDSL hydrolase family protein [Nocardia huaxiensis]QLY29549.1 SGNH/GDSL hydrolase family protein [Nocardia huaxiensis]UFS96889.1 SGNH/GDSL hydrolase family protein [Nocardia huaxiensis]